MKITESRIHYRIIQDGPPAPVLNENYAVEYVLDAMRENPVQEQHWVITMTLDGNAISRHLVAVGPMEGAAISFRDIMRIALMEHAYCFTYIHNHPFMSKAETSLADRQAAQMIVAAGLILRIPLYDMIIVAGPTTEHTAEKAYSFRKAGWPNVVDVEGKQYRTGAQKQYVPAISADIYGRPHTDSPPLNSAPEPQKIAADNDRTSIA